MGARKGGNHGNFTRVHEASCVTPAMEAGIFNHVWSFKEIMGLLPCL
jgi:hypothetical protein